MWIVIGTTASAGDQIIITGCAGAAPVALGERAEIFGVAGKLEAGVVERRLGDRIGDDGARAAPDSDVADGALDRLDRRGGEVGLGRARTRVGAARRAATTGSARANAAARLAGRDLGDRRGEAEPARQARRARPGRRATKNGAASGVAGEPGAQRQLGADRRRDRPSSWRAAGVRDRSSAHERSADAGRWRVAGRADRAADFAQRAQRDLQQQRSDRGPPAVCPLAIDGIAVGRRIAHLERRAGVAVGQPERVTWSHRSAASSGPAGRR